MIESMIYFSLDDTEEEMFKMQSKYFLVQTAQKFLAELHEHVDESKIEVCEQVDATSTAKTFASLLSNESIDNLCFEKYYFAKEFHF